jgi:membrane protease YdiL (CAAX protease family)
MSVSVPAPAAAAPVRRMGGLFWGLVLLMSSLPNIVWQEWTGRSGAWLFWAKVGLVLALLAITVVAPRLRAVRPLAVIFLVLYVVEWLSLRIGASALWQGWFGAADASFTTSMLGIQLRRMGVTLCVIAVLVVLFGDRRRFFLTRGNLNAPAAPERILLMAGPIPWRRFGVISLVVTSIALLFFLVPAARPAPATLLLALPLLPMILLLAAMNAFSEEMSYRASLLAASEPVIGLRHALLLSALYFGIGHYYGVPYGVAGVLMSTFFGFLLGKAMLETRGLFWAWLIHTVADVWIFAFMAVAGVTPGGG